MLTHLNSLLFYSQMSSAKENGVSGSSNNSREKTYKKVKLVFYCVCGFYVVLMFSSECLLLCSEERKPCGFEMRLSK